MLCEPRAHAQAFFCSVASGVDAGALACRRDRPVYVRARVCRVRSDTKQKTADGVQLRVFISTARRKHVKNVVRHG